MNGTSRSEVDTKPRKKPSGPVACRMRVMVERVEMDCVVCMRVVMTSRGTFATEEARSAVIAENTEIVMGEWEEE